MSVTIHRRPEKVLLLLETLNPHYGLFEWNIIRPWGQPRRYKHYANAPECYVTCTLPLIIAKCSVFLEMLSFNPLLWKDSARYSFVYREISQSCSCP